MSQFFDVICCLFMRLHFTVGCYDRRRTPGNPNSLQLGRIEILFCLSCASTPQSPPQNSLSSVLSFRWWREAPVFRRREECSFVFLLYLQDFLCQLPRCFASPVLLPLCLFLRPILKFRSVGGYADENLHDKCFWATGFGLEVGRCAALL